MFKTLLATVAAIVCMTGTQVPSQATGGVHKINSRLSITSINKFSDNEYMFDYLFHGDRTFFVKTKRVNCSTGDTYTWMPTAGYWNDSVNYFQLGFQDQYYQMFDYVCNR